MPLSFALVLSWQVSVKIAILRYLGEASMCARQFEAGAGNRDECRCAVEISMLRIAKLLGKCCVMLSQ